MSNPPLPGATAYCQHCPAEIQLTGNGIWVDADGFGTCVKAPLETIGGPHPGFVLHTPMPRIAP